MRQTYVAEPWVRASKERQVTGKVTEAAFEPVRREPEETSAEAQAVQGRLERQPRWTSHFLPKGRAVGRSQRVFSWRSYGQSATPLRSAL